MYLFYLAYMKNSISHNLPLYSVPVMLMLPLVFFSPENAHFCFLESKLKRATVTSRSMSVASFRFHRCPFIRDRRFLVPLNQPYAASLWSSSNPPPPLKPMIDPAKQKYGFVASLFPPILQIPQITQCNMDCTESPSDVTTLGICYHHCPPCLEQKFVYRKVRVLEEAL
jgi:hypothetical protein